MSNVSRFLNIWIEFDKTYGKHKENKEIADAEELSNLLLWLKRWAGVNSTDQYAKDNSEGILEVETSIEGRPAPCEIRLYKGMEYGFPFKKHVTQENGKGEIRVPSGEWQMIVSHGLEIESHSQRINIVPNQKTLKKIDLSPIVALKGMGWYNGELHHHSIYSSPVYGGTDDVVDTPAQVRLSMQAAGCDFGALSDHHNILNHKEWRGEAKEGFVPIISKEISTSNGHVMAIGVEKDIIYHIPQGEERTQEKLRLEFTRVAQEICELGGVAQINHPVSESSATNWPVAFDDLLLMFNSMEIWNGAHPMISSSINYKSVERWFEQLKQNIRITATAGSDTHYIAVDQYESFKKQIHAIIQAVKVKEDKVPDELQEKVTTLLTMWETSYPIFNEWIIRSLGTAAVRNYVYSKEELTQKTLLNAIKSGRCFITNGPLLLPEIEGAIPGERRPGRSGLIDISIDAWSQRPVDKISLYFSDGRNLIKELLLKDSQKYYYSCVLDSIEVKSAEWVVCVAGSDSTNYAIANPIYI